MQATTVFKSNTIPVCSSRSAAAFHRNVREMKCTWNEKKRTTEVNATEVFVCLHWRKKEEEQDIDRANWRDKSSNAYIKSGSNIRMQISFVRWFFIFSNTMCLVVCVLVFLFDFFLSLFPSFFIHLACSLCCYPLFCGNLCQCCVWANVCALERERECEIISLLFSSSKIRINQIKAIYKVNISINVLECVGLEQNSDDDTPTRLMKF